MPLHTVDLGTEGPRVVFLHGLFGQGRNWHTLGKQLSRRYRVTLVDMPNHGKSSWSDTIDYAAMADEVAGLFSADDPVVLVGHSMGGKVAMMVALRHPALVERLVVADMSPVLYPLEDDSSTGGVLGYARMMRDLDISAAEKRSDVEESMQVHAPHPTVRAFLMQNLKRTEAGWGWAANVEVLARDGEALASWPADELAALGPYDGPVLWIAGEKSTYVRPEFDAEMRRFFPRYRKVTMKNTGHWVHSESPELFRGILERFLPA